MLAIAEYEDVTSCPVTLFRKANGSTDFAAGQYQVRYAGDQDVAPRNSARRRTPPCKTTAVRALHRYLVRRAENPGQHARLAAYAPQRPPWQVRYVRGCWRLGEQWTVGEPLKGSDTYISWLLTDANERALVPGIRDKCACKRLF